MVEETKISPEIPEDIEETYLPEERSRRQGIALCLSGGGFRAALFHLGVLRRLNELGVLSQITHLSTVSGGSIVSAHLLTRLTPWPESGQIAERWDERVGVPFRAFTSRNIRTCPLLQWLAFPWRWRHTSIPIERLARIYERDLTPLKLSDLPMKPQYTLCATDVDFGVSWRFTRSHVGDYKAGIRRTSSEWPLGRAVAASACFPPIFDAMAAPVNAWEHASDVHSGVARAVHLSDGGVYDNLGLEPVWKTAKIVLVSDGGAVFQFAKSTSLIDRVRRYPAIMGNQVAALRKRWLIASFLTGQMQGAYWGIGSTATHYHADAVGYSEPLVRERISSIRTDLDRFSTAEAAVLENHGYSLAEAAIQEHVPSLVPPHAQPFRVLPHPEWMNEECVRRALEDSHKRRLLGRGWIGSGPS